MVWQKGYNYRMNRGTKKFEGLRAYVSLNWQKESDSDIARRFDVLPRVVARLRARMGLLKGKKGEMDYFELHGRRFSIGYWRNLQRETTK